MYDNLKLVSNDEVEGIICDKVLESEVKDLIEYAVPQMKELMMAREGIGIAAPQVGIKKQFSVYRIPNTDDYHIVFNGKYFQEGSRAPMMEGCLSYPDEKHIKTKRFKKIKAIYEQWNSEKNEFEKITRRVSGVESIILQHEIDHWNGKTIYTK